jgi:hypothetical protein
VTELHTSWLDTPPEDAVIEARVEADQEAGRSEQVNNAVNKILDALRSNGYEPALRVEDVEIHGTEGQSTRPSIAVLTDDEHQAVAAVFRPCSVSSEEMTEASHQRSSRGWQFAALITNVCPSQGYARPTTPRSTRAPTRSSAWSWPASS